MEPCVSAVRNFWVVVGHAHFMMNDFMHQKAPGNSLHARSRMVGRQGLADTQREAGLEKI